MCITEKENTLEDVFMSSIPLLKKIFTSATCEWFLTFFPSSVVQFFAPPLLDRAKNIDIVGCFLEPWPDILRHGKERKYSMFKWWVLPPVKMWRILFLVLLLLLAVLFWASTAGSTTGSFWAIFLAVVVSSCLWWRNEKLEDDHTTTVANQPPSSFLTDLNKSVKFSLHQHIHSPIWISSIILSFFISLKCQNNMDWFMQIKPVTSDLTELVMEVTDSLQSPSIVTPRQPPQTSTVTCPECPKMKTPDLTWQNTSGLKEARVTTFSSSVSSVCLHLHKNWNQYVTSCYVWLKFDNFWA